MPDNESTPATQSIEEIGAAARFLATADAPAEDVIKAIAAGQSALCNRVLEMRAAIGGAIRRLTETVTALDAHLEQILAGGGAVDAAPVQTPTVAVGEPPPEVAAALAQTPGAMTSTPAPAAPRTDGKKGEKAAKKIAPASVPVVEAPATEAPTDPATIAAQMNGNGASGVPVANASVQVRS